MADFTMDHKMTKRMHDSWAEMNKVNKDFLKFYCILIYLFSNIFFYCLVFFSFNLSIYISVIYLSTYLSF